jgi:hypothetical protein
MAVNEIKIGDRIRLPKRQWWNAEVTVTRIDEDSDGPRVLWFEAPDQPGNHYTCMEYEAELVK